MTFRERLKRVLHFEPVDRVPNVEIGYWDDTLTRWQKEGLPPTMPLRPLHGDPRYSRHSRELTEFFHLDAHDIAYGVSISDAPYPELPAEVIAEDEETKTYRYCHGLVRKCLKSNEGIFHDLDWPIKDRSDWLRIREMHKPGWHRLHPSEPEKLPSDKRDFPVMMTIPGFFWELRNWLGFQKACMVFYEDPAWAHEMLDFWSEYLLAQCRLMLENFLPEYVQFDEDMAYNHGPMISPEMTAEFLLPAYKKVVSYINSRGIDVVGIDSDGLSDKYMPVLHEAGVNLWSPMEIVCRKGTDDLLALAKKYPWLRLVGGMDKMALSRGKDAIDAETAKITPLVCRGGYLPCIDHKVPPEASLEAYQYYLQKKSERLIVANSGKDKK